MLSPLRKENPARKWWRVIWPVIMHFLIFQFAGNLFLAIIMNVSGGGIEIYNENRILLTGLAGFCVMPFALYFYKRDHARRMAGGLLPGTGENHLSFWDGILLLVLGAGAAHFFNVVVNILQIFIDASAYQEEMALVTEGKSL